MSSPDAWLYAPDPDDEPTGDEREAFDPYADDEDRDDPDSGWEALQDTLALDRLTDPWTAEDASDRWSQVPW